MTKKGKIYAIFFGILFGGYVLYRLVAASGAPKEFEDARMKGATISQDIVNLSNQVKDDLLVVNQLDKEWRYNEAFAKAQEVADKTKEIRGKAVELSNQLQVMTSSLSKIGGEEAKQAVLESVSNRLALLSRLINYSDYISQLVSVLRDRFTGNSGSATTVSVLVDQINAEVTAINSFNQSATAAMSRFDKALP